MASTTATEICWEDRPEPRNLTQRNWETKLVKKYNISTPGSGSTKYFQEIRRLKHKTLVVILFEHWSMIMRDAAAHEIEWREKYE